MEGKRDEEREVMRKEGRRVKDMRGGRESQRKEGEGKEY